MNLQNDNGNNALAVTNINNAEYQWQYGSGESAEWVTMAINKYNVCVLSDVISSIPEVRFRCLVFLKGKIKYYSNVIVLYNNVNTNANTSTNAASNKKSSQDEQEKTENRNRHYVHTVKETDGMGGIQFENYCADILKRIGYYDIHITKASGDFGIDVLATKEEITYAIQCKSYSNTVGNKAVQEACSGRIFYGYDIAVVLTNNYFTPQAIETANKTSVLLWDRDVLNDMIKKAYSQKDNYNNSEKNKEEQINRDDSGDIDFFGQCNTEEELKNRRNKLMKIFHSDTGSGDDKMAAMINRQYEEKIKHIRGDN